MTSLLSWPSRRRARQEPVRATGAATAPRPRRPADDAVPSAAVLELELLAVPANVSEARHAAARFACRHGADASAVALAVSEVVTNVVLHAYGDEPGRLHLRGVHQPVLGRIAFEVSDDGTGVLPREEAAGFGFGLPILHSITTDVRIEDLRPGTRVTFSVPAAQRPLHEGFADRLTA